MRIWVCPYYPLNGRIAGATGAEKIRLQAVKAELEEKIRDWTKAVGQYNLNRAKVCQEIKNR